MLSAMHKALAIASALLLLVGALFLAGPNAPAGVRVVKANEADQVRGSQTITCYYKNLTQVCSEICGFNDRYLGQDTPVGTATDKYKRKPAGCESACAQNCNCTTILVDNMQKCD